MPIYEYRCGSCGKRTSTFTQNIHQQVTPACQHCGGANLERLVSGFAYHRSTKTVWEQSGAPSMTPSDDYYKDPRNIGRYTEQRLEQMGVEMPESARKMIDAAREGDLPPPVNDL